MISDQQAENDLMHLANTDEEAAEKKVEVERRSYALKRIEAALFKTAIGNIEERKAVARTSEEYKQAESDYLDAYLESESINNKRKTLALRLDVYRTQSANRRQAA